ncbi:MAG: hypothetical protein ACTS10_02705 [Kiloniellales bacterium]
MLEDIANRYVYQSEDSYRLAVYVLAVTGAIFAAVFHKSTLELRRAPYFVYLSLLFFAAIASQLVWLGALPPAAETPLWGFMLAEILIRLAVGYGLGVIAMARSRDAFGHARMAFLAFIPLANFWLLLKPSKTESSARPASPWAFLRGGLGVLTGFTILIAGVLVTTVVQVMLEVAYDAPAMQRADIGTMIRTQGLEAALQQIASETPSTPTEEAATFLRLESDGSRLRYIYEVSASETSLPESGVITVSVHNCSHQRLRLVIDAGATIEHLYLRPDGSEVGSTEVTQLLCAILIDSVRD